jgi:hypothetical protein
VRRRHARGELQLDEGRERQDLESVALDAVGRGRREGHGFRFSVTWIVSDEEKIDPHARHGVAHGLQPGCDLDVPAAEPLVLEAGEILGGNEDVDVLGQPPSTVGSQSDGIGDRVRDPHLVEDPADASRGLTF